MPTNTPPLIPVNRQLLRVALLGNAFFSAFCGLLLLVAPGMVSDWMGLSATWVYRVIGVSLVLFAADLLHQATRSRMASWRGLYASIADFTWVGGTVGFLFFVPDWFSPLGLALLTGVAVVVLVFGILQFLGVKRLHHLSHAPGRYRHCIIVEVDVAASMMWETIARLGEISRFMPALKYSSIRDNQMPGPGCVRQCGDQAGKHWAEECTLFDPHTRTVALRFLCDEPGFPFPATSMDGGWEVIETGHHTSEVMVWWELVPKPQWLGPVLLPIMAWQVDRDFPRIIASMAADTTEYTLKDTKFAKIRLAPRMC